MKKSRQIRVGLLAFAALTLIFSGCGGGGTNGAALTGKVIDGYLTGALVCLDVNDNKACDSGEPTATSTAGGVFSLKPPSDLDLSTVRLIANVPATAVDEDTNSPVGTAYQITAPANVTNVTPLTTLALAYKDQGGTWAQAIQSVKTNLGISDANFKVDSDYVADANIKTHNVAKLVAGVLQTNQTQGSTSLRLLASKLSSNALTAFNTATNLSGSSLTNMVSSAAANARQKVYAASYTALSTWNNDLSVYMQGTTDTGGIFGWGVNPDTNIWKFSWNGVAGSEDPNGANFSWGSWDGRLPNLDYIESWIMTPTGFDITGMGKINIKVWGNKELETVPRFTPVLQSQAINGCVPTAKSNNVLNAATTTNYVLDNQADASFSLNLSNFTVIETCNGQVSTMAQFILRPLASVRVRIYKANSAAVEGINLGAISFEP